MHITLITVTHIIISRLPRAIYIPALLHLTCNNCIPFTAYLPLHIYKNLIFDFTFLTLFRLEGGGGDLRRQLKEEIINI